METARALISVSDKRGIVEFAQKLSSIGIEILSTGGTAKALVDAGIPVKNVADHTGFPEIMNGRVKTLHPRIHGGLLARRDQPSDLEDAHNNNIEFIDIVVANLYPFEDTLARPESTHDDIIENIDIGGPSMIRSAAKNFRDVLVITDPEDYMNIALKLEKKEQITLDERRRLATKAFSLTSNYDAIINDYLKIQDQDDTYTVSGKKLYSLRYGENPHQTAAFYRTKPCLTANIPDAEILNGKELSFNNIIDASSALELVKEFSEPAVVFIKHNNPCGVAISSTIEDAFIKSHQVDSMSAFGSITALNRTVTPEIVDYITENKLFLEIIIAPQYHPEALKRLQTRKNLRIIRIEKPFTPEQNYHDIKFINGGMLIQTPDQNPITAEDLKVVTTNSPDPQQIKDLLFADIVAKHVKSNAVVMAKNGVTTAIGAGQMSRLDSVRIANFKGEKANQGAVMASDAFFPFADAMELAIEAGITSFIQPGGSVNDSQVITRANELGVSMVFSNYRHFRH
ncbi:bifunctional phosphoribosylaminoimidazolecarboxamide formyltransferase/inosine monophosphate cyclohydrolase [Candidatus Peregrinibacteria bacterium HGW-Peregrinibacteria-1]|jgi:phosphoribosylaminoimidazolecarboxamide formyltransferase/IMP cyclohydrolase|nr:MAG: bifunctional phosphoribosylaminoimidazolecarboxamide formyltransferase/inosine monophosphate cyclohydrolase [Candidatus Peregrinibacteria bacterium HGW-Peregrinibacteria-1]